MPQRIIAGKLWNTAITVERGCLSRVGTLLPLRRRVLIVSDSGVPEAYYRAVEKNCEAPVLFRPPCGEGNKCLERYTEILQILAAERFTRSDCVVAVGGGVVGDLAGFAAATYMRGIDFYQIPTTLLSQVDSSIGGKVAVDFDGYKNLVGAFYPARAVLVDPDTLQTLPGRQIGCGMAEIIKMFAIADGESFRRLEKENGISDWEDLLLRALRVKAAIVEKDERESGLRRNLNFGHTVGHALESVTAKRENPLLHGESVGIGMLAMSDGDARQRIAALLNRFDLPTTEAVSEKEFLEALCHDKKTDESRIHTILVGNIGECRQAPETIEEIRKRAEEVLTLL